MDEDHPLNPRSPYAATKAGADRLAYAYHVTYGLPIVIVRPFNNYGPYQHPEKVIPRFITQALLDEPLTVHGDGRASRDWLYVDDDAEAIEAVIDADIDEVAGEVVNVATGVDVSVGEIADLVLQGLGKPASRRIQVVDRPGQVDRHIGSTEKAARLLGWRARTSFEDGLERTIAWYAGNRAWWQAVARRGRPRVLRLALLRRIRRKVGGAREQGQNRDDVLMGNLIDAPAGLLHEPGREQLAQVVVELAGGGTAELSPQLLAAQGACEELADDVEPGRAAERRQRATAARPVDRQHVLPAAGDLPRDLAVGAGAHTRVQDRAGGRRRAAAVHAQLAQGGDEILRGKGTRRRTWGLFLERRDPAA